MLAMACKMQDSPCVPVQAGDYTLGGLVDAGLYLPVVAAEKAGYLMGLAACARQIRECVPASKVWVADYQGAGGERMSWTSPERLRPQLSHESGADGPPCANMTCVTYP